MLPLRGHYTMPGGASIHVRGTIAGEPASDGVFTHCAFESDAPYQPDNLLARLAASLEGVAADTSAMDLSALLSSLLLPGDDLAGLTTDAIAIALRRMVGKALDWTDLEFDIIYGPVLDPAVNVALDETLVEEVAAGRRKPFLRMWEWNAPQVVIGSYQSYANELHHEGVLKHGITVTRRVSGGGTMFMEPENCVTFSLVAPTALVEGMSFEQAYPYLDRWVMEALETMGVKARYVPLNDIASDKGKIAGAAQKRWANGMMLHHVTMAYDIDTPKMLEVLRTGLERVSERGTASAVKWVDPLRSQISLSRAEVMQVLYDYFRAKYGATPSALTPHEIEAAKQRCVEKFSTEEWTFKLP